MNNNLERNVESTLNELKVPIILKYDEIIKSIFIFLHLLIPILSVEGLFSWVIGIWGSYKIINIYRNSEENRTKKAIKSLIVFWTIALVYNILVYYVTKVVVAKVI